MACSMASASEDDFLRVLEEMNRLCGEEDSVQCNNLNSTNNNNNEEEEDIKLSAATSMHHPQPTSSSAMSSGSSNDPLEDIFAPTLSSEGGGDTCSGVGSGGLSTSTTAPLIGDQLLSSVASNSTSPPVSTKMSRRAASASNLNASSASSSSSSSRSRHCSANSAKSCVSFDSAIGDVYSVQTPTKGTPSLASGGSHSLNTNCNTVSGNNNELDIFDFSSSTSSSPTLATNSTSTATASAGLQFDNLAASVCFDSGEPSADLLDFDTSRDVDGLGGISLRLVGSEDVDLLGTSFSLGFGNGCSDGSLPSSPKASAAATTANTCFSSGGGGLVSASAQAHHSSHHVSLKRPAVSLIEDEAADVEYFCKAKRLKNPSVLQTSSSSVIVKQKTPTLLTPQLMHERQEVERICLDLLRRFQHACVLHPKTQAKVWMAKSAGEDPLLITTRLITDSLARLRIFVHSLDPMNWLMWNDRHILYSNNVCILSVFKAAVSVNLEAVPMAYPLPYGEYLGEVEALHLILAHDLYNELRALLSHIQSLGIREFPVMLLVMMIAFFSPQAGLKQPDKVVRVNDYYMHKLQVSPNVFEICNHWSDNLVISVSFIYCVHCTT